MMPGNSFDPDTAKPELTVKVIGGFPEVRYKREKAHGIFLYVDRRDGNGFVLIDKMVLMEYVDRTPLPANTFHVIWEYKARFMVINEEVGEFSETVVVNVLRID
jgi:hypothetical protein